MCVSMFVCHMNWPMAEVPLPKDHCWFAPEPLQMYLLLACQHPAGGLRDKPNKSADFYHTCYALSGMAVSQYDVSNHTPLLGDLGNLLERTDARSDQRKKKPSTLVSKDATFSSWHYY